MSRRFGGLTSRYLGLVRVLCLLTGATAFVGSPIGCNKPTEPLPLADIRKDYDRPLPPGQFALRKLEDESEYPPFGDGWYKAKGTGLRKGVEYSLEYLKKPSSKTFYPLGPITHERVVTSLKLFLQILDQADSPQKLDELIRQNFDVYISVGCDDEGTVLFTGYYSPIFDGSLTQTERFQYPVYRLPSDIKKDQNGDPIGGPWRTREEIETSDMLAGSEIVWLQDPFEAYVLTVQGSGFIRMEDGKLHEIGYSGHNGHEYVPISHLMVADGKIDRYKLSLDTLIKYFKEHPDERDHYLFQNKRYIFFQEATGGPYGCLGQPVTPYHTVATDKEIFPRAALTYIDTRIPLEPGESMRRFRNFALDQDRGAAIRAPGRCDTYIGVGDDAGTIAGHTYSEGKLYYLFAKEGLAPQPTMAQSDEIDETTDPTFGRQ